MAQAFKSSEAQEALERALEAARAAAWSWNLRTGRVARSKSAARLYGLERGTRIGRGLSLIHPADRAQYRRTLRDAVSRRGSYLCAFRLVRPSDGRIVWLEESGRVSGRRGKAETVLGLVVDVSERRAAEQRRSLELALTRAFSERPVPEDAVREALRRIAEEFGWDCGLFWALEPRRECLRVAAFWSAGAHSSRRFLSGARQAACARGEGPAGFAWARGRTSTMLDLKAFFRLAHAREAFSAGYRAAVGVPIAGKRRIIGALVFYSRRSEPLPEGAAAALDAVGQELGQQLERRQAELALDRQRREQQIILDTVPAMIWFKDAHNRILRCNRAAAEWFGRDVSHIEGRTAFELFPAEGEAYYGDDLEVLRTGQPKLGLLEHAVSPRGGRCWIRRDLIPYEDAQGRPVGVIVFAVDVTAVQRAQKILRESERQKEFLANVSHELRTPVAAIKGFAETLLRGALEESDTSRRFVRIIANHADRLGGLVDQLLTLSALDGGRGLERRPVNLSELACDHVAALEPLFRKKNLKASLALRRVDAAGDPLYLRQVLDNLLSNAVKYTPRGRRVAVSTRREGARAVLRVRDEGVGIAPEHQSRIFDRFFRVEGPSGRGHSGLGLHIVKKIIDAHGGKVDVESLPGRGTTFTVSLPVAR